MGFNMFDVGWGERLLRSSRNAPHSLSQFVAVIRLPSLHSAIPAARPIILYLYRRGHVACLSRYLTPNALAIDVDGGGDLVGRSVERIATSGMIGAYPPLLLHVDIHPTSGAMPENLAGNVFFVLMIESFLQISVILLVQGILAKQHLSWSQRSLRALGFFLPFFLMQIMMAFGVVAGLMVFIVPGIFVFVRWTLAPYFMMLQGQGALASLKSSWRLTQGYGWDLFFALVVMMTIGLIPSIFMLDNATSSASAFSNGVLSVAGSLIGAWSVVMFYRAFDYIQANPRIAE